MPVETPRAALERLRVKYATLVALHDAREQRESQGFSSFEGAAALDRRATFRSLAAEFPGALRELDASTRAHLAERRDTVAALLADPAQPHPAWVRATWRFHALLGEALQARRGAPKEAPGTRVLDAVFVTLAAELGVTPGAAERLVYPGAPQRGVRGG